jgi:hypothetical protein
MVFLYCVPVIGFLLINFSMSITYKNYSTNDILRRFSDIQYAEGSKLYGFGNILELDLGLNVNAIHVSAQADVFAREILANRSAFDLKRFLGPYDQDWQRILHETYVYDRCKCIYYGLNSNNMMNFPELVSFPGNVLLANLLKKRIFQYDTGDSIPHTLFLKIVTKGNVDTILGELFKSYPDVRNGISEIENSVSYVNPKYESVMRGLYNAKTYLDSNKNKDGRDGTSLFEIVHLNDSTIASMLQEDSNPVANSFLNSDMDKFSFILPQEKSKPLALKFNESIFISRALGFTSEGVKTGVNTYYSQVNRDADADRFAREEVYSVTALKSEYMPYSGRQILEYLNKPYTTRDYPRGAGTNTNTP